LRKLGRLLLKKKEVRVPSIELEKYFTAISQHILHHPSVFNIISPDYNVIHSAIKFHDLRSVYESKKRLPLEILWEAKESYREGILRICTRRAESLLRDLRLHRDPQGLGESLYNVIRALALEGAKDEELERRLNIYAKEIKIGYTLPDEKLVEIVETLRELYNHLRDAILLHYEIENEYSRRSIELRETVFKIIEESLNREELKGVCFICGEVKYDDVRIKWIKSILGLYPPFSTIYRPSYPGRVV
jgi:hypothetical protein